MTWADEDIQINALHFVSKLVIILQWSYIQYHVQLCDYHCIIWYSICILVIFPCNFINFISFCVVHREFLHPTSTKWVQMLIFQVYIIINSLYIIHSSQLWVFFTFLVILVIFIKFGLIGNDLCHSHSRHVFSHHRC